MTKRSNFKAEFIQAPEYIAAPVLVEVVYGLISRDCKGMGICKLNAVKSTPGPNGNHLPCCSSLAHIELSPNNQLIIHFLKTSVSEAQFQMRFALGVFELAERFDFLPELAAVFKKDALSLAPGVYPLVHTDQYMSIAVPIELGQPQRLP